MTDNLVNNGEIVLYEYSVNQEVVKGKARVCGIATADMPILGRSYILQDISGNFPSDDYKYEMFVLPRCKFKTTEQILKGE